VRARATYAPFPPYCLLRVAFALAIDALDLKFHLYCEPQRRLVFNYLEIVIIFAIRCGSSLGGQTLIQDETTTAPFGNYVPLNEITISAA
jgi:hypothetical protein